MPPTSRGKSANAAKGYKVVKPKSSRKHTTQSTKNHRFQSFNDRIANLKIDPIRRKRHVDADEAIKDETHTHFREALSGWQDSNLSRTFTAFATEVAPLCDNLAVVLHNEDKIMDLLVRYIEMADSLAMEPLLSLLSHFAHDLDTRFEKHFQRAVATVTAVAAKHQDLAVVEWSFTALAWLFKYLSRLLVPDLRPLYDLLLPYLGKESHRPFIVRFTAEALSFLLRKAAIAYSKDQKPLQVIMAHIIQDCVASEELASSDLHQQGIMTMLTEAVVGVQNGLSTSAVPLVKSLLDTAGESMEQHDAGLSLVSGVLTSLVHHCTLQTFQPIQETLLAYTVESLQTQTSPRRLIFICELLFTVISVRKGTRISEWRSVMQIVSKVFSACDDLNAAEVGCFLDVLRLLAVSMQTASIGAVVAVQQITGRLHTGKWADYFLRFCVFFERLGMERFKDFILPGLQKFVIQQAAEGNDALFVLIPRVAPCQQNLKLDTNPQLVETLLTQLDSISTESSPSLTMLGQLNNKLVATPWFNLDDRQQARIRQKLAQLVHTSLQADFDRSTAFQEFALGTCFHCLLELSSDLSEQKPWWSLLCHTSSQMVGLPRFWSNLLRYIKMVKPTDLNLADIEALQTAIVECVSMPSHVLRQNALDVLQELLLLKGEGTVSRLATAIVLESTPVSLDSSRSISMNIRRLAQVGATENEDEILTRAIPSFCFGLLHLNLAQAWDDSINSLATMSQTSEGEEVIMDLVQSWLDGSPVAQDDSGIPVIFDNDSDGFRAASDFECPNLMKLQAIAKQALKEPRGGFSSASEQLNNAQQRVSAYTASTRNQALKVLHKLPRLAEKRSRLLVPILLSWASSDSDHDSMAAESRWSRKDQKAMLAIFALFVNPKVLYKSSEVYDALLYLCANGDAEIQRSALKALLAWREPVLARYEEHLNNLLDEARFREEISVFLRHRTDDEEVEGIFPDDQPKLMPILLRLLYGRAVAGGKEGQAGRRKAIFVALSRFGEDILGQFIHIALVGADKAKTDNLVVQLPSTSNVPLRRQLGLLNMINDMLEVLVSDLEPFASTLMNAILAFTVKASHKLERPREISDLSLLREIRQTGLQCLVKIFSSMTEFDAISYGRVILDSLIVPRLTTFAGENAQSVSALLRLMSSWSQGSATSQLFLGQGTSMLESIADLLQGTYTKPEVRLFVLQDILDTLLDDGIDDTIIQPHVSRFVQAIGGLITQQPPKEVLDACVQSFSQLAGRINSSNEAAEVTRICSDLLVKPSKTVSASTKINLLRTLLPLVQNFDISKRDSLFSALCALFSRLSGAESRQLLSEVLTSLTRSDSTLVEAARICEDLNSMGTKLDVPDHERRERGFAWIYDNYETLSLEQWWPIVHNCLFYIRDRDDRVNRSSASHALQLFVSASAKHNDQESWLQFVDNSLLSGIEWGVKDTSELVRAEYLAVLGKIINELSTWERVSDMHALSVSGDDEASFFMNILHIQQHRRLRALKRLTDESTKLKSHNVSRLLLPLLEHFIFDQAEGDSGRTMADQTVQSIGAITKALNRQAFRGSFQRYTSYLKSKPDLEKTILRLLGVMVDSLRESDPRITPAIVNEQLPPLLEYLHLKDESTVDRRMPVAVTVVKLMQTLPEKDFSERLPAILTDVSHVLRSRSQEARDQTRKALAAISKLVGARYFYFMLKELRSALKRGYQLHVLSYTVHSLLVDASFAPGDLDACLPELMLVIMDDIFGITGQEKDAEEYKSGMKEVKSSKSYDTLELLARVTPIIKLGELIRPIRALLSEKLDVRMVRKLDELLSRLRKGLDHNPDSESRDMLKFCWEVVSQVYAESSTVKSAEVKIDERMKRYLVQPEAPRSSHVRSTTTSYSFKLISFVFDLLRKVLRRHEDLQTSQNIAGFLPMAGDALLQGQEEVKLSALRFLSTIMRIPLAQLEKDAPLYVKEAVALINGAPNMSTDAVKAGLELITSVLREKRAVIIKEKDVAALLKRIKTDLDEPDRQGMIFRFLRAALGRKIVITEIYEVMDEVAKAMVTNPDTSVRESARSAYFQFVMEYPQGKDRWQKQTAFLVANLRYEHASGRKSVMEFLHQMLSKVDNGILAETSPKIFVSLLLVIVSDSDTHCREMAKLLVGKLFDCAGDAQMKYFLSMMNTWLGRNKKATVKSGALRCWSILMQTKEVLPQQLEKLRDNIAEILNDQEDDLLTESDLIVDAFRTFGTMVTRSPAIAFEANSEALWYALQREQPFHDAEVETEKATLIGLLFTDFAKASSQANHGLGGLPLHGSGGLELSADKMRQLCATILASLQNISLSTSQEFISQIVNNLRFLGRCFDANGMPWQADQDSMSGPSDNDEDEERDGTSDSAIATLIRRLSQILSDDKYGIAARTASLTCLTLLFNQLTTSPIPSVQSILRPLYALTDPNVPKPPGDLHKALEDKAHEALELIQKNLGKEEYMRALTETRNTARKVREERRQKRKIGAVKEPEKWERIKKRKHEVKKGKIKARGEEMRGRRSGW